MYKSSVVFSVLFLSLVAFWCVGEDVVQLAEQSIESYQTCRMDSDCRENSMCYGNDADARGRCICRKDYVMLSRNKTYYACLKVANNGEACVQDNQCYEYMGTLAKCDETCQCPEGTHLYERNGQCYQTILLDDICKYDANCRLKNGSYVGCYNGKCTCYNEYKPSNDKRSCVLAKRIGETCSSDEECEFESSICRDVCRCTIGYVLSNDRTQCLLAAQYFGDPCQKDEHAQCTENLRGSICYNGNCSCPEGEHGYNIKCVKNVAVGESCSGDEECILEKGFQDLVSCEKGTCKCKPGAKDEKIGCNSASRFSKTIFVFLLFFLFGLL